MNTSEPSLSSVLPAASREVIAQSMNKEFRSALKLPRGMNRHLVARGIDLIILDKRSIDQVGAALGLVHSETEYIEKVVAEFRAWEAANTKPAEPAKEQS